MSIRNIVMERSAVRAALRVRRGPERLATIKEQVTVVGLNDGVSAVNWLSRICEGIRTIAN